MTLSIEVVNMIVNEPIVKTDDDFYMFRSAIQHFIKRKGIEAIIAFMTDGRIREYYENKEYLKSLYLLSCLDTLCIQYNLPLCSDFEEYRQTQLIEPVMIAQIPSNNQTYLQEFKRHNIYEVSIYDVC